jgi:hypothetical protein
LLTCRRLRSAYGPDGFSRHRKFRAT